MNAIQREFVKENRKRIQEVVGQILSAGGNAAKVEEIVSGLLSRNEAYRVLTRDGVDVLIQWTPEDVQTLRPRYSVVRCANALQDIRNSMEDRSVELGWEVMETALNYTNGRV